MILLTVPMTEQLPACLHPCIQGGLWREVGRDVPPPARQVRLPHYLALGRRRREDRRPAGRRHPHRTPAQRTGPSPAWSRSSL